MAYLHITTADGREFVGTVQGFGGSIGSGAAHLGADREKASALRILQHCILSVNHRGRMVGVYEPQEALLHCQITSVYDWKVPFDGAFNCHYVPLRGAKARLLTDEEVKSIPPGTCRYDEPDPKALEAAGLLRAEKKVADTEAELLSALERLCEWESILLNSAFAIKNGVEADLAMAHAAIGKARAQSEKKRLYASSAGGANDKANVDLP